MRFRELSDDTRLLLNLFLPFYAMHSVEHVYLMYGSVLQGYGLSPEAAGWILGVYFLSGMLARPFGGWMLENFGIRRMLLWSGAASFAGTFILLPARAPILLFIGRALSGASFGLYTTGLFSHQAMCVSEKARGTMLALLAAGGMLPMATAAPLGEWFLLSSREYLYLSIGPVLSAVCWVLGGRVRSPGSARGAAGKKEWGSYRGLLASRTFLAIVLNGTLIALVDAIVVSMSVLAGENGLAASYFLASGSVAAVIVRVAGSRVLNSLPRVVLLAPCGIMMAAAMIAVSFFPARHTFIICGIVYGTGIGAGWPMFHALLSDTLEPALRPKGTAAALLLYDLGFFLTPLLVGYLSPMLGTAWTFTAISAAAGAVMTLLEIFYWIPLRRRRKNAANPPAQRV